MASANGIHVSTPTPVSFFGNVHPWSHLINLVEDDLMVYTGFSGVKVHMDVLPFAAISIRYIHSCMITIKTYLYLLAPILGM